MAENLPPELSGEVEQRAWMLRRKGMSTYRIADELAKPVEQGGLGIRVHQTTVYRAMKRVEAALHTQFFEEAREIKARHTEILDNVIEEAMDAWERSKQNAESEKTVVKSQGAKAQGGSQGESAIPDKPGYFLRGDGEETTDDEKRAFLDANAASSPLVGFLVTEQTQTKDSKGQAGDPRFLEQARAAMREQRDIWGLDAAKKTDITSGGEKLPVIGYEVVLTHSPETSDDK